MTVEQVKIKEGLITPANKEIKSREVENKNNRLSLEDSEVYFSEDIWNINKIGILKFDDIYYIYRDYVKDYMYRLCIANYSKTTIGKYLGIYKDIIKFLVENSILDGISMEKNIAEKFNQYLDKRVTSEGTRTHYRRIFREELLESIEIKKDMDYHEIKSELSVNNTKILKAQMEKGKTPNIPNDILNRIIKAAIEEINDTNIHDNEKIGACCVLLISQIGMRISELGLLEAGKLKTTTIFENEIVGYIDMFVLKEEKYNQKTRTTSFMTDKAILAYETLEKITINIRKNKSNNLFFMTDNMTNEESAGDRARIEMEKFYVRNYSKIGLLNIEVEGFKIIDFSGENGRRFHEKYKNILPPRGTFYISTPKPHQFRVAVCNELVRQGVDISWVMQHMNHLTPEMTDHYIRNEKEESDVVDRLLVDLVKGEYRLIGEEAKELIEGINEFLDENEFNVEKNLDEIIKKLKNKVPIREKKEGFCIKSSFGKACKRNEFHCAFDMCNNFCTSYLFTDITYKRFKNMETTIEYNKKNGFEKEAQIEIKKIKQLVRSRLSEELKEVEYEINRQGLNILIKKNPELEYIIKNIESINIEVKKWM